MKERNWKRTKFSRYCILEVIFNNYCRMSLLLLSSLSLGNSWNLSPYCSSLSCSSLKGWWRRGWNCFKPTDNWHSHGCTTETHIRKLFPRTALTKPNVWSQTGGEEHMSPTSHAKAESRDGLKVLQGKQDVTSPQTATHPTPAGLAKARAEHCEYLLAPLSAPSIPSPICCPNVSSIWEITLNLDATLEPIELNQGKRLHEHLYSGLNHLFWLCK